MAQLIVRKIDANLVRRLKLRAAHEGRSAEATHREILKTALMEPAGTKPSLKDLLLAMPDVGSDQDFKRSRHKGRKVRL